VDIFPEPGHHRRGDMDRARSRQCLLRQHVSQLALHSSKGI
jgi:hypothetical protein